MNNFLKSLVSVIKIVALVILAYIFLKLLYAENEIQVWIGVFVLVFITLPTIYIIFFKKKWEARHSGSVKVWKVYRIFYVIFIILYAVAWSVGVWHLNELSKTQKTVDFINSKKITLNDVMGKNLPPPPDQKLNDSTIAGIDANKNYIRDDVELLIFKEYPNFPKIREAELQYAQALQLELTQVYNSATFIPVLQKESRGIDCIGQTGPKPASLEGLKLINDRKKEVDAIVLNTDLRKKQNLDILNKYMSGYASLPGNECDIEIQ